MFVNRFLIFIYGAASYFIFFVTFLYAVGFVGDLFVPKSLDSKLVGRWQDALVIDLALLGLFALQHSGMARRGFKSIFRRVLPVTMERSTYVLASSLALALLFWQWRPLGGMLWNVQNRSGKMALIIGFVFGWSLVLITTFVINHFDLFGLRQVWRNLRGKSQANSQFVTPFLYRIVRHPLYLGFLFAFWCTPTMTISHLVFAAATTVYILVAIQLEERDLMREHREYVAYRQRVPMLVPGLPRHVSSK